MSAPASASAARRRAGRTSRTRSRSRRLTRASGSVGAVEPDHGLPVEVVGQPAQRAQEEPQGPRSSSAQ